MLLDSRVNPAVLTTKFLFSKDTAPIVVACLRGCYDILADMPRKGAQTNIIGNIGSRALEAILARGNHSQGGDEVASLLLSYSQDLRLPSNGSTVSALGTALHLKWLKTFERLLKMGANVEDLNERPNKQYFFLPGWNFSSEARKIIGVPILRKPFPESTFRALCRAAGTADHRFVALLLQYGANVDGGSSVLADFAVHSGKTTTPLLLASACGNKPVVELLLGYGANVDLMGVSDMTERIASPLICVARKGYSEVLELLLEHGAQIGSEEGILALQSAVGGGHQDIISALLDNGVEVKAKSPRVSAILICAAEKGYSATSKLLFEHGTRIRAAEGTAALISAIDGGHQNKVFALLDVGVDVNAKNGRCSSAVLHAAKLGHFGIVRILVQHGCEV
ncbi:ankyrin [Hyaloscypha hepaticicola]|uniref:Ankyrin n=1 Tax=Hyaloscypha hepaticicola TaxID=2082293 RepID=A0A2J6QDD2_9HELO|nr:ankyrin [Hyaloscypha hepaticicola]